MNRRSRNLLIRRNSGGRQGEIIALGSRTWTLFTFANRLLGEGGAQEGFGPVFDVIGSDDIA